MQYIKAATYQGSLQNDFRDKKQLSYTFLPSKNKMKPSVRKSKQYQINNLHSFIFRTHLTLNKGEKFERSTMTGFSKVSPKNIKYFCLLKEQESYSDA